MNMVQEIQFLTSDETLQKIVRANNLVRDFDVVDEAAAVVKLRGMLNLVEAPDGGSIDIEVHGDNFTQGYLLTQHLAEAQEGDRPNFEKIVQALAADPDKKVLSAVLEKQQAIQEQIRVNLINALNQNSSNEPGKISESNGQPAQSTVDALAALERAQRAYDQQTEVLSYVRLTVAKATSNNTPAPHAPSNSALDSSRNPDTPEATPAASANQNPHAAKAPHVFAGSSPQPPFLPALLVSVALNLLFAGLYAWKRLRKKH
ncbi:MAG: hypothetical protein JWL81_1038 [Verrucomicrobiales bacterium]|nr:hypothetical protein [Verrucomicrobiales bacterium]